MDQPQFHSFMHTLQATLAVDPHVLALVAIGSLVHPERVDRWSDHDFWVVTTTEVQTDFLSDLAWLPNHSEIVLTLRPAQQYHTVLYSSGRIAEFAVFGLHDLSHGRLTEYRILFDRQDITARLQALAAQVHQEQRNSYAATATFGYFLITLCTGVGRAVRGELLSAYTYIFHYALDALLKLIAHHISPKLPEQADSFDPRRRCERLYPELSATLIRLVALPPIVAARQLLDLAEELFANSAFDIDAHAAASTRAYIARAEQEQLEL